MITSGLADLQPYLRLHYRSTQHDFRTTLARALPEAQLDSTKTNRNDFLLLTGSLVGKLTGGRGHCKEASSLRSGAVRRSVCVLRLLRLDVLCGGDLGRTASHGRPVVLHVSGGLLLHECTCVSIFD